MDKSTASGSQRPHFNFESEESSGESERESDISFAFQSDHDDSEDVRA